MNRSVLAAAFLILLGAIFTACIGTAAETAPTETPAEDIQSAIETLSASTTFVPSTPVGGVEVEGPDDYIGIVKQAWHVINTEYVRGDFNGADWNAVYDEYIQRAEEVTSSEELWDLLTELVDELNDDHSRFVPPDRLGIESGVETSLDPDPSAWTGIIFYPGPSREDEYLFVWDVCGISPAASAGITKGDIILAIDGNPVERVDGEISRDEAYGAVFGTGADQVTLTIWQGPDQEPVNLTIPLGGAGDCPYRTYGIVNEDPRIGYIRVPDFDGDAESVILENIHAMEEENPLDGLVVDVRHNPGGNSDDSISIFTEGIVGTVGKLREDEQRQIYRIRGPVKWNETTPLVVLTDGSSHSAADYFPTAIKELGRGIIVGMNSAGNTEGIIGYTLADGTYIRLAITTLVLNDGTILEGVGVTPDVVVPLGTWGLKQQPFDIQLQAGIDTLLAQIWE